MIFPNGFMDFRKIRQELSFNELPPTVYSLMQSIVNYDKEPEEQVKIKDLPIYARSTFFNFTYPCTNINKEDFEILFLKHYMFRRINFDTLTSFRIHLDVKLNVIMPKYDKMMEGFNNLDFLGNKETHTRTEQESGTDTTNKNETSNSSLNNTTTDSTQQQTKFSDTPQSNITDITDGSYVTEFTNVNNSGTSTSGSTGANTNSSTNVLNKTNNTNENIVIDKLDSIDEYRKYIEVCNSIYEMIFKECDDLFYGVI